MTALFKNGYALLIGVDQNTVPGLSLPVVARDVAALHAVLTDPQVCAYPDDQVTVVTGAQATRDGMFEGLDWLRRQLEADESGEATAVVYYSGHGWRDESVGAPEHFLIPYATDQENLHRSALSARDFAREIERLRPRRLLVLLDCCHAHGMGAKGGPDEAPEGAPDATTDEATPTSAAFPPDLMGDLMGAAPDAVTGASDREELQRLRRGQGRAVLSSSRGEEQSYYFPDERMSFFTYHLIEALTGHAQTSAGQTEVLVSDVLGYLPRVVPRTAHRVYEVAQNPDFRVSGNFSVAMLLGGKGLSPGAVAPSPDEVVAEVVERAQERAQAREPSVTIGRDARGPVMVGDGNISVGSVRSGGHVAIGNGHTITGTITAGDAGPHDDG